MSPHFRKSHIALAVAGAAVAISTLSYLATKTPSLFLLGSVGASALLIFALPEAPLSQPRSVVLGHVSASLIAFGCLAIFGSPWWGVGVATGLSIGFMMLTRTLHPPAGSNAMIVFLTKPTWGVLLLSTLGSTVALIAIAVVYHRTTRRHRYPVFWMRPELEKA